MVASWDGRLSILMYQFLSHCDLDLVSRIIMSEAYLIYFLREEFQIRCMVATLDADNYYVAYHF